METPPQAYNYKNGGLEGIGILPMVDRSNHNNGTCDSGECGEPTPWDKDAIIIGDKWFCSPECARGYIVDTDSPVDSIILHDPQYHVDRKEVSTEAGEPEVDIEWSVSDTASALVILDEIAQLRLYHSL